ncbi:MAG: chromosome partitioning protein [Pseudoalteromonas tetraodonis]|jgi:chromosome partitioning protein
MARIISVANQKGGVGKTTTTVSVAHGFAKAKRRVLMVDLDPQGNATMGAGIDKHSLEASIVDVLLDGLPASKAILESEFGFAVLPANGDLTAAEVGLMNEVGREGILKRALATVADNYDYVFIDCPPSLNLLTLNALAASQGVLIPMQCEYYALEGISALTSTIRQIKEAVNPELEIDGILRTMFDNRNRLGQEVSAQLEAHFPEQLLRTIIPRNIRLAEAPSHGIPIIEYDKASRGAKAYIALAGEMLRREKKRIKA